jgi:hypothetical protein
MRPHVIFLLLFRLVQQVGGQPQVLDGGAADVTRGQFPESITILRRADHVAQIHVHPRIARHQPTVVRVATLQFDQQRRTRRDVQQRQRQLFCCAFPLLLCVCVVYLAGFFLHYLRFVRRRDGYYKRRMMVANHKTTQPETKMTKKKTMSLNTACDSFAN